MNLSANRCSAAWDGRQCPESFAVALSALAIMLAKQYFSVAAETDVVAF